MDGELAFAMEAFADVLAGLGHRELASRLPWSGKPLPPADGADRSLGQAYSIAFQLLNLVEERVAAHVRRLRENENGPAAEKGLWPDKLREMARMGLDDKAMLDVLRDDIRELRADTNELIEAVANLEAKQKGVAL